jgi:4-hydroxybenzoate polyprenyltransferase
MTVETQIQLGMHPQLHPYLFLIFFATLFEYNLHRLITVLTNKKAINSDKHSWVKKHLKMFYLLVLISIVGFSIAILQAKMEVLLTLMPIAVLTLFYSTPISKRTEATMRLRQIPFIKIFLISFVWSAVTILLPLVQSEKTFNHIHIFVVLLERFLFIFAITVPFDIRDMVADANSGLKTLPLLIGKRKSIALATILLFFFIVISLVHYLLTNQLFIFMAFIVSSLTTLVFIMDTNIKNLRLYYYGILDGTILLQGILMLVFYQLKDLFQY